MAIQPQLLASERSSFDVKIHCPGKINHFLHVLGRRDDGYHDLQTGFQFIEWGDWLHYRDCDEFRLTGMDHVACEDNLIWKAAHQLARSAGIEPYGHLEIEKNLPAGAGIGGGSSNAASTLLLLREQWRLDISDRTLMQIGTTLGADVPIFLYGMSAIGTGIGEQLEPIEWGEKPIQLFLPGVSVPTAKIFNDQVLTRDSAPISIRAALDGQGHNDCEPVCRQQFPKVNELFRLLDGMEPKLSGSGGTVFVMDNPTPFERKLPAGMTLVNSFTRNRSSAIKS